MKPYTRRHANPDRTEVRNSQNKWLAMLTDGAYTVTLTGPRRTFAEPAAADPGPPGDRVPPPPRPFDGNVDTTWLTYALKANEKRFPDVLAIAMQYIARKPAIFEGTLQIA